MFDLLLDKGGDLTQFMTREKARPATEPMFSGGNIHDFKITSGYATVDYTDFISCHVFNSENILISQSIHNGAFSGIFASSKLYNPRPVSAWGIRGNYDDFLTFVNEQWKSGEERGMSRGIYSLTCDEKLGFGAFFMKGYGSDQSIVRKMTEIQKIYDKGLKITACASQGSTFYIIMTKNTKEYHGKEQEWFTRHTWDEAKEKINEGYRNGMVLTGICYSTRLEQYFVVITKTRQRQTSRWFTMNEGKDMEQWVDHKYECGFHPSIIFTDPTNKMVLIVVTSDQNKLNYVLRSNYNLR